MRKALDGVEGSGASICRHMAWTCAREAKTSFPPSGRSQRPQEEPHSTQTLRRDMGPLLPLGKDEVGLGAVLFSGTLFGEGREVTVFYHINKL